MPSNDSTRQYLHSTQKTLKEIRERASDTAEVYLDMISTTRKTITQSRELLSEISQVIDQPTRVEDLNRSDLRWLLGTGMRHYLVVLVPRPEGGWRAHFPDFPGCRAEGQSVEAAINLAATAAADHAKWLRVQGVSLPAPQTYYDLRQHGHHWAAERGIDWTRALATIVKLRLE